MLNKFFGTHMTTTCTDLTFADYIDNKLKLSPSNKVIIDNFNNQAEAYKKETQDAKYENLVNQRIQESCNDSLHESINKAKEYFQYSQDDTNASEYYFNKGLNKLQEATDILNNCRRPKFIDDSSDIINKLNDYIHSLNSEQLLALCNLFGCITILLFLISLITIYYSDYLIKYFQLEDKNTWLAKFILIRKKFNNFYYGYNVLIILGLLFALIFVNLLGFIY